MPTLIDDAAEMDRMKSEWSTLLIQADPVPGWKSELVRMQSTIQDLISRGQWRSGRRTLLGALGVHHDEVIMCRGLAWVLTPDAWHGLGTSVLDQLLAYLRLPTDGSSEAVVVVEEPMEGTRADIVIRFGTVTVLLEAKVWAIEQPTQCDRLALHWSAESPTLVFLTRDGKEPVTAVQSAGAWIPLAWSDFADWIESALCDQPKALPGVNEYLETLRIYGGSRS